MEATAGPSQCTIPVPHQSLKLILTPPRLSDGTAVIASLNDARVHMTLNGPPYPYTEEDWDEWYRIIDGASSAAMEELHAFQGWQETASSHLNSATDIPKRPWVGKGIWISTIRDVVELDEARKEKFIGEISVQRGSFLHVLDEEEREKRKEENDQFEARDPRISREIGCRYIFCRQAWLASDLVALKPGAEAELTLTCDSLSCPRVSRSRHHADCSAHIDDRDPHSVHERPYPVRYILRSQRCQ